MPSNSTIATRPHTPPDQVDMTHSGQAHTPSPAMSPNKTMGPTSPSPAPSHTSAPAGPTSKDLDQDKTYGLGHRRALSNNDGQQHPPSSPVSHHSPSGRSNTQPPYGDSHQPRMDEHRGYNGTSGHEHRAPWPQSQAKDNVYMDTREHERHPPSSSYHNEAYYNNSSTAWSRPASPSASNRHLSFTRHAPVMRPRSPPHYPMRPPHPDMSLQRNYSESTYPTMTPSHDSSESYQGKRHRHNSDSDGYSDHESRYRYGQISDPKSHHMPHREREPYHGTPYQYTDPNVVKPHHQAYADYSRDYHAYSGSAPVDGLPPLAPRPPRYPGSEDSGLGRANHSQQQHYNSGQHQQKKDEPFKIQSARGTPKGPLPIDIQISLLTSVLQHDPFNCAIRKTTQAWEMISREQGIRARTCSRRFDNIIQASIAGRDRPVGTEEQQATKKKLLEQLFDMMNQPQALKRMQKKRRYRSEDTDRRLLLETIRLNPFAQKVGQVAKAWEDVRDALGMKVHARQCIRRVNRMVKPYQLRERMYKGNIPDDMKEANDDLVKQVINLMKMSGQGGSLDEGNSGDDDSGSGMSDSDEQEDTFMESKDQSQPQEDDELEEDEDQDMKSRSDTEQQKTSKNQEEGTQPATITPVSPSAPALPSPSTQPTTPSNLTSAPPIPSGSSSTPVTPAKRGRPRNPVPSAPSNRPSSRNSSDRTRSLPVQNADGNIKDGQHPNRTWEVEGTEPKTYQSPTNGSPENPKQGLAMQSTPLSSPLPVHTPPSAEPHAPSHSRHYSQGDFAEPTEGRRPIKHARTGSRSMHDAMDISRSDRTRPASPTSGRQIPVHGQHNREREEPNYRYSSGYSSRGPTVDSHGRPIQPSPPSRDMAVPDAMTSAPSFQQYRDVLTELHIMREYLSQLDVYRRSDLEKQDSMMYMVEKLQHQMQQQQQQISHLQHQLRYGGYAPQQQQQGGPPPPHSPHQSQAVGSSGSASSGPSSNNGRYTPHHSGMDGRPVDRHGQEMPHHVSYSRSDAHYSASRDRDPR